MTDQLHTFRVLVLASRPASWINTAYPFAAAYAMTTRDFDLTGILGALYFLIPYNLAMYGINDVFDYESDVKNARKGGVEGALVHPELHRRVVSWALTLNVPLLVYLFAVGSTSSRFALALSVFGVLAYSVPVLRFKERPLVDSITSSWHFVSPAVVGLTLADAEFTATIVLVLTAFFSWAMAAHAFGAVQDIEPDTRASISSIATFFGARTTVRLALALWTLSAALLLLTSWPGPLAALFVLPYLVNALPYIKVSNATADRTHAAWQRFMIINYGVGFFVTMLFIYVWVR